MLQPRKWRLAAQPGQHRVHALRWAGNRAVNTLGGQQNQAFDSLRVTQHLQRHFELRAIRQIDKQVKGRR